jgi:hypothetical protein
MKGKLKKWLKENGKNSLGKLLDKVGENTSIPIASGIIESIGESLMDEDDLTPEQKQELAKLINEELKIIQSNITDRWKSDNEQPLKLPKLIRPIVLAYTWVVITAIVIIESCSISIISSSLVLSMCGSVNLAYFGVRTFEKIKNKS